MSEEPNADHLHQAGRALKPTHVKGMFGSVACYSGRNGCTLRAPHVFLSATCDRAHMGVLQRNVKVFFATQAAAARRDNAGRTGLQELRALFPGVRMRAGEAQHMAAGAVRGRHARHRVLHHDTVRGRVTGAAGGHDEHVRLWLAPRHMLEGGDAVAEEAGEMGDAQGGFDPLIRRIRGDTEMLRPQCLKCRLDTIYGAQVSFIELEQTQVLLLGGIGRKAGAKFLAHLVQHRGEGPADEAPVRLVLAHHDAVLGEDLHVNPHRQRFGIDEHAVAVENQMRHRGQPFRISRA